MIKKQCLKVRQSSGVIRRKKQTKQQKQKQSSINKHSDSARIIIGLATVSFYMQLSYCKSICMALRSQQRDAMILRINKLEAR